MNKIKYYAMRWAFLVFIALFVHGKGNAQSAAVNLPRVIPPSPEAASIARYGIYPVSMFTGVPSISVPVYKLEVKGYTLPITLDYHASGIKVDEYASWVGLGWVLNAGGVITRSVVGTPDEHSPTGLFYQTIKREEFINETDYTPFAKVVEQDADSEPDIFYYNFSGKSGKFVFAPDKRVLTVAHDKMKIVYKDDMFNITDTDGTLYRFEQRGLNVSFTDSQDPRYFPTTSWYLTKIILPNKVDSIAFSYYGHSPGRLETIDYILPLGREPEKGPMYCIRDECYYPILWKEKTQPIKTSSYVNPNYYYVKEISFSAGKIRFPASSTRSDFGGYVLDSVIVENKNQPVKKWALKHDYFYSDQGYNVYALPQDKYRLKLTEFAECGLNNEAGAKFRFEYEEQYQLPPRKNCGIDWWGYNNGRNTNEHLIPLDDFGRQYSYVDINSRSTVSNIAKPANRDPDENNMKAGMIKRIYYPTGGYTDFDFEPNKVATKKVIEKPGINILVAAKKDDPANDPSRISEFISPITLFSSAANPPKLVLNIPFWGDVTQPYVVFENLTRGTYARYTTYPGEQTFRTVTFDLWAGEKYRVTTNIKPNPNDPNDDTDDEVLATVQIPSNQTEIIDIVQLGPGLRIKSIKGYNSTGELTGQEDYKYGENESGMGQLSFFPYLFTNRTYTQNYTISYTNAPGNPVAILEFHNSKLHVLSKPIFNYSSIGASSVFYPFVTKYEMANSVDNGKTTYTYDLELDDKIDYRYPDPQLLVNMTWKSGNLLSEKKYRRTGTSTYKLVEETENKYTLFSFDTTYGLKIRERNIYTGDWLRPIKTSYTRTEFNNDFEYFEYPVISGVKKMTNTTHRTYSDADATSVATSSVYTYNNLSHLLPGTIETTDSKGSVLKRTFKYPQDKAQITPLTAAESVALDSLVKRNMIQTPVEQDEYENNILAQRSHFEYNVWSGNNAFVGLKKLKVKLKANNPEDRYEVFAYDQSGNTLEQAKSNDAHEVYLWGYNNTYPVARIVGSTYAAASALVSQSVLQAPAGDSQLRDELNKIKTGLAGSKALVTTYTYDPLTGVTSETDPTGKTVFYEYDAFKRLRLIKDSDGKILKQFDYQYQKPITQ